MSSRRAFSAASSVFSSTNLAASDTVVLRDLRRGVNARGDFRGMGLSVPRPPAKLARGELKLAARVASVAAGLDGQAKRRADYKKTLPVKPMRGGLLQYIKKNAWEKDD